MVCECEECTGCLGCAAKLARNAYTIATGLVEVLGTQCSGITFVRCLPVHSVASWHPRPQSNDRPAARQGLCCLQRLERHLLIAASCRARRLQRGFGDNSGEALASPQNTVFPASHGKPQDQHPHPPAPIWSLSGEYKRRRTVQMRSFRARASINERHSGCTRQIAQERCQEAEQNVAICTLKRKRERDIVAIIVRFNKAQVIKRNIF
jgi:hypothetical protein